jgi:thymidylate kinase
MLSGELQRVAYYLPNPFHDLEENCESFSSHDVELIFSFLRKNKVIMRSLNYSLCDRPNMPRKVAFVRNMVERNDFLLQSYDYARNLRQQIVQSCEALGEGGVDLIFVKSNNDFPLDSDNFDVLVREQHLASAKAILEKRGFKELKRVREPFKWLYRRVSGGCPISLHLHTKLGWEGVEFLNKEEVWNERRLVMVDGIRLGFPSSEHHLLMTAAHAFFENQSFRLSDLMYAVEAVRGEPIDWCQVLEWCSRDHWLRAFVIFLQLAKGIYGECYHERFAGNGDETIAEILAPHESRQSATLLKRFGQTKDLPLKIPVGTVGFSFIRKVALMPNQSLIQKSRALGSASRGYIKRRLPLRRESPTLLICFSGHDGTGKTSHALRLRDDLTGRIHAINDPLVEKTFRIKYVWSRGIGSTFEPVMQAIRWVFLGSRNPDGDLHFQTNREYQERRTALARTEPTRTLWAYLRLADELLVLAKVRGYMLLRQMVICDRYIYDVIVDVECGLKKNLSPTTKRIVRYLSPDPSLVFVMDLEPTETVRRRKDSDRALIECSRQNYKNQCRQMKKWTLIDATTDFEVNHKQIVSLVLNALFIS